MKSIYNEDEEEKVKKDPSQDAISAKLLRTRQIILSGEVNKELAEKIASELLVLDEDSDKPISIYIDSPGGDVDSGFAIFDMIRFVKAPVYLIGMGLVASAAALIILAVPKERRLGLPNSHYLIHQPLSGMNGVATDIQIHAKEIARTKDKINQIIAEATGMALEQVVKDTDRDHWLDACEAHDYGIIGSIVSTKGDIGV